MRALRTGRLPQRLAVNLFATRRLRVRRSRHGGLRETPWDPCVRFSCALRGSPPPAQI